MIGHMSMERRRRLRLYGSFIVAVLITAIAFIFCFYPAVVVTRVVLDTELRKTGQSRYLPAWFEATAGRHRSWAAAYLESGLAEEVEHTEVAATEWPMFGAVFFLVAAETLHARGAIDVTEGTLREAIEKSAQIVVSPVTATWVRTKWGDSYLEKENIFYRMLLVMGLTAYEGMTKDRTHHALLVRQRESLAEELAAAPLHLLDDYPDECYPNDILWAVAAIQRAAVLDGADHEALAESLMETFNRPPVAVDGLPAFQMNSRRGTVVQEPRGSGNSGILIFAAELDPSVARDWYRAYEEEFWKDTGWIAGFTELPQGLGERFMDVDSGPVLFEFGSVASAFGIGAANTVGRLDHSVPLTMEAIACSWPTPFGFLIPRFMGEMAVGSSSLGEVALWFSMTRPSFGPGLAPFDGRVPYIVWCMLFAYIAAGLLLIGLEVRGVRRALRRHRAGS